MEERNIWYAISEHFQLCLNVLQCALERKIPIVRPTWITENYQIWLRGDDVDVAKVGSTRILSFMTSYLGY